MIRRFYPSVTCAIGLRFDDALTVLKAVTPSKQVARAPSTMSFIAQQQARLNNIPSVEPLFVSSGNSDPLSWLVNVVPRSASFTKPGFRDAGTFRVDLGYHDLPIDPRLVKAAQVRIFAGCVSPEDFARGVTEVVAVGTGNQIRSSVIQGIAKDGSSDPNLLAVWGAVDEFGPVKFGDNPTISLTGRDLRSIFIASPMRRGQLVGLDLTKDIVTVVNELISRHPLGGQMGIKARADEWPNGEIPSPGTVGNLTAVHLDKNKKATSGPPPAQMESKLTWWDAICQYTFLVGAVPYFVGKDLIIRPARSLYDLRNLDPFDPVAQKPFLRSRIGTNGLPSGVRQLIYGHNVSELSYSRKLQGPDRPKIIEVVSLDTSSGVRGQAKLLRALYPKDLAKQLAKLHATKESPSGQLAENEVLRIPIYGINGQEQLDEIARAIFETTARFEVEGSFETRDLASYTQEDGNDDPDMLRLAPGDPVEISVAAEKLGNRSVGDPPIVSDLTNLNGLDFDDAVDQTAQSVGDVNFARAIVATRRGLVVELESTYRVSEVTVDWSKDTGAKVSGKFHNFIEARYGEKSAPRPTGKTTTLKATTLPRKSVLDSRSDVLDDFEG